MKQTNTKDIIKEVSNKEIEVFSEKISKHSKHNEEEIKSEVEIK